MQRRLVTLNRDCSARLVPTGDPITVAANQFVTLTQTLGGSFTIIVNGNMARIAGKDADALGLHVEPLEFSPSTSVETVDPDHVWQALQSVYDPEIPVNIADLGLIYDVSITQSEVAIKMTLTAPGCGMGPVLIERVIQAPGVTAVEVELVLDPPWSRDMMSEAAQLELGIF